MKFTPSSRSIISRGASPGRHARKRITRRSSRTAEDDREHVLLLERFQRVARNDIHERLDAELALLQFRARFLLVLREQFVPSYPRGESDRPAESRSQATTR